MDIKLSLNEAAAIVSAVLDAEDSINKIGDTIRSIEDPKTRSRLGRRYGKILGILIFEIEREALNSHDELTIGHPRGPKAAKGL
jgi:hypothetical protein